MVHLVVPQEGEVVLSVGEDIHTSAEHSAISAIQELMGPQWLGDFLE
jgi:hypothetical protein